MWDKLARYAYAPSHGHFKTAMTVFRHLKQRQKGAIKFDTKIFNLIEDENLNIAYKNLHPHAKEKIQKIHRYQKGRVSGYCWRMITVEVYAVISMCKP